MSINLKKYFEEGKKLGLDPYQISFGTSTETTVSVFNNEVETQQIGASSSVSAKGLYEGKIGHFSTDAIDSNTAELMAKSCLESAKYGREDKADNFFKGGKKYRKAKVYFADFVPSSLKDLRAFALEISKIAQAKDKRITKTQVDITMTEGTSLKANSLGLKCKDKSIVYVGYVSLVAENEKGEPRSGGYMFTSFHNLDELKVNALKAIDHASKDALDFFGSGAVKGKNYKVVLSPDSVASLLSFYVGQLSAKSVHKHLSLFEGKINTEIASTCLTILHTPHVSALGASSFDSDGEPTCDFPVIKKGVLVNYFQSLETANEEHIESNGCGQGNGNAGPVVLTVKPGRYSRDDLFKKMNNGLYINSISGLNSGIDGQTLDFSLPCQGYVIKDGEVKEATSMIICAGNLKTLFESIKAVGNDSETFSSTITPSILVKQLAISGK